MVVPSPLVHLYANERAFGCTRACARARACGARARALAEPDLRLVRADVPFARVHPYQPDSTNG